MKRIMISPMTKPAKAAPDLLTLAPVAGFLILALIGATVVAVNRIAEYRTEMVADTRV